MTSRDKFEQAYAEDHNCTLAWCQSQRLSNGSYDDRFMARAWHWWQRAAEMGGQLEINAQASKEIPSPVRGG